MHQAAHVQFERAVRELARWRAEPVQERSPAPAWWWGPALEISRVRQPMPAEWCSSLTLPAGSSFATGADVFLQLLVGQTSLPWAADFPRKAEYASSA